MNEVRLQKQLTTQLSKEEADFALVKAQIEILNKELQSKNQSIQKLKTQIKKLQSNEDNKLKVSEHAIVRYFERVKGFNIEEIEKEILADEVIKMVETLGGKGKYPNKDFTVVMQDFTVTTII